MRLAQGTVAITLTSLLAHLRIFIAKGVHPFHFIPINSPDKKTEMEKRKRSIKKNAFYGTPHLLMFVLSHGIVCH